jgi:hypothetical protein
MRSRSGCWPTSSPSPAARTAAATPAVRALAQRAVSPFDALIAFADLDTIAAD